MKRIFFVRHGETIGNHDRFCQSEDTPLTEQGHLQAKMLAERCVHLPVEEILTSDMTRAADTAAYVADALRIPVTHTPLFRERARANALHGVPLDSPEYKAANYELKEFFDDPSWRPEGAENYHDLITRADHAERFLIDRSSENMLVVTHGAFLVFFVGRIILRETFSAPIFFHMQEAFEIANTGIITCTFADGQWRLVTWNDRAHFAE